MNSRRLNTLVLLLMVLAMASPASANQARPLTSECVVGAASQHGVHVDILLAILMVEGGRVGHNSRANKNGSYDIGPFQINSIHLGDLSGLGVSEAALRNDGCVNAQVAAWHLRRVLTPEVLATVQDGDSYLSAIARYHSVNQPYNRIYAEKLRKALERLNGGTQ